MIRHLAVFFVVFPVVCFVLAAASARAAEAPPGSTDAFEQCRRLGRGVNAIGYDPIWRDRSRARFQAEHFRLIREAGFQHVRINLHPFRDARADAATHRIPEAWLSTLEWVVDQALAKELMVVLDFHEFTEMAKDPMGKKARFLSMWSQIAEREKDRPADVLFEILNEPNGELTPKVWNELLAETLALIRRTNPRRTVVIGPAQWNSIDKLAELELPADDRNIIVTVHYYSPFAFTHQGAGWTSQKDKVGVPWNGTPEERAAVERDFDRAQAWALRERRPIYLGEFGAYDRADMDSRVRWTSCVAREAEKRGWAWAYWQFDGDFVVYKIPEKRWVEPIRDALLPKAGGGETRGTDPLR